MKEPEQWAVKQHLEKYPKCEWICLHTNKHNLGEVKMEDYDNPTQEKFEEVAKPLIKYLAENYHPHVTVIVTATEAEVLEGLQMIKTEEYLRD